MSAGDDKKIFLVVTSDHDKFVTLSGIVRKRVPQAIVYEASDASEALLKIANVVPHVIVTDLENIKMPGTSFVDALLHMNKLKSSGIVIAQALPPKEIYLNEITVGRVQYLDSEQLDLEQQIAPCLYRALDFAFTGEKADFRLRFVAAGDVLLQVGEKGNFVYILKEGQMEAYNVVDGQDVVLGLIQEGEFVGEMAYVNGEPRSACVRAVTECELIEIPIGTFERVLYLRPAWSKNLMMTLSRRLKLANAHTVASSVRGK